jgi:hypothetical protein
VLQILHAPRYSKDEDEEAHLFGSAETRPTAINALIVDRYGVSADLFDVQVSGYFNVSASIHRLHHDKPVIDPEAEVDAHLVRNRTNWQ